uniref:Uncharacterized protein n=1 Tax=Panagrolaimus sp. PS1159 TaxID=55785 RepID=A0AC35EVR2_9BILA
MIVHEKQLYIIDVSQSVEHDHPNSLVFLRSDIANVSKFFKDQQVPVLSMRRLFEFIVDPTVTDNQAQKMLEEERTAETLEEDVLFMNAYIPHKLDNITDYERDDEEEKEGLELNNPFQKIIGKIIDKDDDKAEDVDEENSENEDDTDSSSVTSIEEDMDKLALEAEKARRRQMYHRDRHESPTTKNERKKLVKEEKRVKRTQKVPKHVKKRHENLKRKNR